MSRNLPCRALILLSFVFLVPSSFAQEATCVRLKALSNLGVPLHPGPGDRRISDRLPHGTVAQKDETDEPTGWIKVKAGEISGWIIDKYIEEEVPCDEAAAATPTQFLIGCWNLEHFHEGAQRGFPENTHGGPTYPAREQQDYVDTAAIIKALDFKILVLSEIFAEEVEVEDADEQFTDVRSSELERLIAALGAGNYDYVIAESGKSQHLAILYDTRSVQLNASWEMDFPKIKVQGKNVFDRQPLVAHFTFIQQGALMNDLAVVGVHLASGQRNNKNHDLAMQMLQDELEAARSEGWCIPQDENDIIIMGDFNANRFDEHEEGFWDAMESVGWNVLADEESEYPPTRLSGVPLGLRNSRIDYIIVSAGLSGEEVSAPQAAVHEELLDGDPDGFRERSSDHLPVSIPVTIGADTDMPTAPVGGD